jgi:hypothetical protein
MNLIEG